LFKLSNIKIKNKQIIEEKDKSIHNLQGALGKKQKFKSKLQDRNNENSHISVELKTTRYKINMEKQNKDLENIKLERDSL